VGFTVPSEEGHASGHHEPASPRTTPSAPTSRAVSSASPVPVGMAMTAASPIVLPPPVEFSMRSLAVAPPFSPIPVQKEQTNNVKTASVKLCASVQKRASHPDFLSLPEFESLAGACSTGCGSGFFTGAFAFGTNLGLPFSVFSFFIPTASIDDDDDDDDDDDIACVVRVRYRSYAIQSARPTPARLLLAL
jgi:hypothetical protein